MPCDNMYINSQTGRDGKQGAQQASRVRSILSLFTMSPVRPVKDGLTASGLEAGSESVPLLHYPHSEVMPIAQSFLPIGIVFSRVRLIR